MATAKPMVPTTAICDAVKRRELQILGALGIHWPGKAPHIRCPYPDHSDKHPSWRWDHGKKRAYCTCTSSDSIFDVLCKIKGIDFAAAKIAAAEIIGRTDLIRHPPSTKFNGEGVHSPINNTTTPQHSCHCTVTEYAEAKRLPVEFLQSLGLADISYRCNPAVRIPYFDPGGAQTGVRFRLALEGKDKFRWRRGDKALLYGLARITDAHRASAVTLVEGESDCHTLWYAGFPAIGLPGASSWNEDRDAATFDGILNIFIVIEPDSGGDAVRKWLAKSKIRDRAKLVRLDGYKDPSALYLDDPARFDDRWRAALDAAVPWQDEAERERQQMQDAAWSACAGLARCPDILSEMARFVQAIGLVGEERIAKLIYLAVTSRLLSRIVSIAVKGPSSGGKSFLVARVLELFPPEALYVLTAMSDHALAYGEDSLAHRMIVLYEAAGLTGDFGTYLVRSLLSEGRICYDTVEKTADGLKARRIERDGPTGLITTTTAVALHPENETRLLSVNVTDTPKQTQLIMRAQAGTKLRNTDYNLAPWHALQQVLALEQAEAVVPFAGDLAELVPPVSVRLRRDFPAVLALIQAHALLHQASRERSDDGAVVATFKDYTAVREIVADLIAQGLGATVSDSLRETVRAVKELASTDGVSTTALAQKLGLDKSSASRRTKEATNKGYLRNLEDKRGRPARLVLGDPLPDEVVVLPTPETLMGRCCTVAPLQQEAEPPPSPATLEEEKMSWTV